MNTVTVASVMLPPANGIMERTNRFSGNVEKYIIRSGNGILSVGVAAFGTGITSNMCG
jgi:hypothetical protein